MSQWEESPSLSQRRGGKARVTNRDVLDDHNPLNLSVSEGETVLSPSLKKYESETNVRSKVTATDDVNDIFNAIIEKLFALYSCHRIAYKRLNPENARGFTYEQLQKLLMEDIRFRISPPNLRKVYDILDKEGRGFVDYDTFCERFVETKMDRPLFESSSPEKKTPLHVQVDDDVFETKVEDLMSPSIVLGYFTFGRVFVTLRQVDGERLRFVLTQNDSSGSGDLSRGEFLSALNDLQISVSDEEFEVLWDSVPRTTSGKLFVNGLLRLVSSGSGSPKKSPGKGDYYDSTGSLLQSEISTLSALRGIGEEIQQIHHKISSMCRRKYDLERKGVVTYRQYRNVLSAMNIILNDKDFFRVALVADRDRMGLIEYDIVPKAIEKASAKIADYM